MPINFPSVELPSALGRYRILSPKCGLRVSPIQLGAMSIGQSWSEGGMGAMDKELSFKLLDRFYELGGNFIDTANNYQNGESERWIGEWMESRGNREEMVIATKYTTMYKPGAKQRIKANFCGNHYKSMVDSVDASLENLKVKYIDILYLHWWEYTTSIEEIMQGLNNLVKQGKVLYLAVSDTPAWVVSKANQYARDHGLAQFVLYQGLWNPIKRDLEREVIPMLKEEGMGFAPWGALGEGKFKSKAELARRQKASEGLRSSWGPATQTKEQVEISNVLEKIGTEVGLSVATVALAWALQKYPYVYPICGGRKIEHLEDNVKALTVQLSDAQMQAIESAVPFEWGFPFDTFGRDPAVTGQVNFLMNTAGTHDFVKPVSAIKPTTK